MTTMTKAMTLTEEISRLQVAASAVRAAQRQVAALTEERDGFIYDLWNAGQTYRDLGAYAGLSHTAIAKIVRR